MVLHQEGLQQTLFHSKAVARKKKGVECGKDVIMVFMDMEKVNDSVNRDQVYEALVSKRARNSTLEY